MIKAKMVCTTRNSMYLSIAGIISITALEITALCTGQDGAYLLPIVGAIGVAVGLPINISSDK